MRYRRFGKTDWQISQLSLGTVELGLEHYGLYGPAELTRPTEREGVKVLLYAFEQGINFVDTAPTYGVSEDVIGIALKQWPSQVYTATKVSKDHNHPIPSLQAVRESIRKSVERSLERLGRDCLDLVQIHNATAAELRDSDTLQILLDLRQQGKVRHLGVSVYEMDAALESLRHPEIVSLQLPYNLLDQSMAREVFVNATASDIAIVVRSALLKGVLTERYRQLPPSLFELRQGAAKAHVWSNQLGDPLPQAALRFCLSNTHVATVLLGVRNIGELCSGLTAASKPPIDDAQLMTAGDLAMSDGALVDPRRWGIP